MALVEAIPGLAAGVLYFNYKGNAKEIYGGEANTTNNRMELTATIKALEALTKPCSMQIYSDSKYVLQGITEWMANWKKRGWKTASKAPVKNEDLWRRLDAVTRASPNRMEMGKRPFGRYRKRPG